LPNSPAEMAISEFAPDIIESDRRESFETDIVVA
jgi:hypothetical protein